MASINPHLKSQADDSQSEPFVWKEPFLLCSIRDAHKNENQRGNILFTHLIKVSSQPATNAFQFVRAAL